jgi:hypothetical protein
MAIAKNLASHGTWGVTPYEFSGAGSSLLWPLLLAALDRLTGLGARLSLLANVLPAVLVTTLAYLPLKRLIVNRMGQTLALGLVIVATPLPALALVGMEHTLECATALGLTLAGVSFCLAPAARDRRLLLGVALLAFFTVAVRFDAASIVVALVVLIAVTRGWRFAVPVGIGCALPVVAYAAMAWRHGWPATRVAVLVARVPHRDGRAPPVLAGRLALSVPANSSDPVDVSLAVRAAQARGVRVSMIVGPNSGAATGWQCVAAWTSIPDPTPDATMWLFAADADAASKLARDLRAFDAEHLDSRLSLSFADARHSCPADP